MVTQTGQNVVAVLPDSFSNNKRRIWVDRLEHIHSHALIPNETVLKLRIIWVSSHNGDPLGGESLGHPSLHILLGWPTLLISRQA